MKNVNVTATPYVIAPTGDTANFAENKLCVLSSGASQALTLPTISGLRAGDMSIYIYASGNGATIAAQGGNTIVGATSVDADAVRVATAITPTVWFVR